MKAPAPDGCDAGSRALPAAPMLAIDTSGMDGSVALLTPDDRCAARVLASGGGRGEQVADAVRDLLAEAGLAVSDLAGLAVVDGPGSYTGLRVGLAFVRGLRFIEGTTVTTLGSLELAALACAQGPDHPVLVVLPASATKAFVAGYRCLDDTAELLLPAESVALDELEDRIARLEHPWMVCVEARGLAPSLWHRLERFEPGSRLCELAPARAGLLARIAASRLASGRGTRTGDLLPVYVGTSSPRRNRDRVVLGAVRGK